MDTIIPYAVWAVIGLVGLSLLALVVFGLRSIAYGKINILTLLIIVFPFALLLVLGLVLDDWTVASMYTLIISLGLASLSLVFSGLRSMIGL